MTATELSLETEVASLLARSRALGADPGVTNYGGGNTSVKVASVDPVTGDPVTLLVIKGSGGDLGTLTADGLACSGTPLASQACRAERRESLRPSRCPREPSESIVRSSFGVRCRARGGCPDAEPRHLPGALDYDHAVLRLRVFRRTRLLSVLRRHVVATDAAELGDGDTTVDTGDFAAAVAETGAEIHPAVVTQRADERCDSQRRCHQLDGYVGSVEGSRPLRDQFRSLWRCH